MTVFYVYALYRDEACQIPFYVGKGKGVRMHEHEVLRKHDRNPYKKAVIKKTVAALGFLPKQMLHTDLDESVAFDLEKHWIAYWGRVNTNTGILTNMTDGGEGTSGFVYSAAQRAASSALRKGRPTGRTMSDAAKERLRAAVAGVPKTLEHREKLRDALLGRAPPALALIRAAEVNTGVKRSQEFCENLRLKMTGRVKTPEHCAAISAAKKGIRLDPEVYARQLASRMLTMAGKPGPNAGRVFTAEERENMRRAHVARWKRPGERERCSQGQKARRAREREERKAKEQTSG